MHGLILMARKFRQWDHNLFAFCEAGPRDALAITAALTHIKKLDAYYEAKRTLARDAREREAQERRHGPPPFTVPVNELGNEAPEVSADAE